MRHELKETLIEAYRPMGIVWHPIMFQDEVAEFNEPWILPAIIPTDSKDCKSMMPGNFKRNWWIKNNEIIDGDYYVTVDDDDMYEPGVFDAIRQMDDDIVIISMKRGHSIPKDATEIRKYPTSLLYACKSNIKIGSISAQQSFVKGKIFKEHLFSEGNHCWDGEMAIHHRDDGEQIAYRPDLFALFNYYEPGRWNKTEDKIAFGVMVNDLQRLDMCLKQSEIKGDMHFIKTPESATKGLNKLLNIIDAEGSDIAVLTHQDMFYRHGWIEQVQNQLAKLPDNWIVAGIIGKDNQGIICGKFHDMRIPLLFNTTHIHEFPHPACCFDECCIIVNMKSGFRFDETMDGFDLYGTLAVIQAYEMGGTAWIIDAFAEHYCMRQFTWAPDETFKKNYKWLHDRFNEIGRVDSTAIGLPKETVDRIAFMTSAA